MAGYSKRRDPIAVGKQAFLNANNIQSIADFVNRLQQRINEQDEQIKELEYKTLNLFSLHLTGLEYKE